MNDTVIIFCAYFCYTQRWAVSRQSVVRYEYKFGAACGCCSVLWKCVAVC